MFSSKSKVKIWHITNRSCNCQLLAECLDDTALHRAIAYLCQHFKLEKSIYIDLECPFPDKRIYTNNTSIELSIRGRIIYKSSQSYQNLLSRKIIYY